MSYTDNRKAFLLYVDLDPIPGTFHTPFSAYLNVRRALDDNIYHYNPVVVFASEDESSDKSAKKRACFVVFVDLDPIPGAFHSQESAQHSLRVLLYDRFPHYNPMVSLAPPGLQYDSNHQTNVFPRIPLSGLNQTTTKA